MDSGSDAHQAVDLCRANTVLAEVDASPTIVNITRASRLLEPHRDALAGVSLRVACLSSFTFDPIVPALTLQGLRAGLAFDAFVAPFGQIEQALIDGSCLGSFEPDVVLVAARLQDVCPGLYEGFNALNADQVEELVAGWLDRLRSALVAFRQRSQAHVLVQDYDLPAWPALGIADRSAPLSQARTIADANARLSEMAASIENVYVMDYDALVARCGRANWQDARTALYARIPVAPAHYWSLAGLYVRHVRPLYGLTKKVLVLDADNTLWGGIVGDVGTEAIALGHDYPGNAYVALQRRVLDLHHRGVVLCLASKNEPGTVEAVLEGHPEMVLRSEHFAAMRIGWDPKPESLRAMAADLNLGLDSFVFVDDSAVECELMRTALPQVLTVQLPADPAACPGVIASLDCFDQSAVSDEDRRRGSLYRAQGRRRALQTATVDMPTFYRGLEMSATLFVDHVAHVARAAQLTNRTSQFNMHTVRCSEDDIRRFMEADDVCVVTLGLADRFGDNGVVGLAVVRLGQEEWVLGMLLMSCRVLGRTVEQTFVGWIADRARAGGAKRLVGEFVPTAKNRPFAGFFKDRGFVEAEPQGDVQRWTWALSEADLTPPDWFRIQVCSS